MLSRIQRTLRPMFQHEQLLMICVSTVLVMAGQGVVAPILPIYADNFGVTAAVVGLTISIFALARLILNIPMGFVADRFGRRSILIAGPLVTTIGMIGSGFAFTIYDLLFWRFVAGAGSAMYMTGAQIYLADISTNQTRARFIGTNQGALQFGQAIGPAIGGILAEFFGLRVPFIFVGLLALVATFYAYFRLPETREQALAQLAEEEERNGTAGQPRDRYALWRFMASKDFLAVSSVTMAIFFTRTAARQTLLPLLASVRLGMTTGAIGGLLTMMAFVNLVLIAPAAMLADRAGRKWAIVPSGLVVAASLVVLGFTGDVVVFITASFIFAVGASIAGPAPAAYMVDIAPPHLRGIAMGIYRSAGDVGFVIGPPLLGLIYDLTTSGFALSTNAMLMAATAVFFLVAAKETLVRRPPESKAS